MCVAESFSGVDMGRRDGGDAAGSQRVGVEAGVDRWGPGRLRSMASRGEADDG